MQEVLSPARMLEFLGNHLRLCSSEEESQHRLFTFSRRALLQSGALIPLSLLTGCTNAYHEKGDVRDDKDLIGHYSFRLHNGLKIPQFGSYKLSITSGVLARKEQGVFHNVTIPHEPPLEVIRVAVLPLRNPVGPTSVEVISALGIIGNNSYGEGRIHTVTNFDPKAPAEFEAYWDDWRFTRLTWNRELLPKVKHHN